MRATASYADLLKVAGLGANADHTQGQPIIQRPRACLTVGATKEALQVAAEVVARWRPEDGELLFRVIKVESVAVAMPRQMVRGAVQIGVSFFRCLHLWFVLNFRSHRNSQPMKEAA